MKKILRLISVLTVLFTLASCQDGELVYPEVSVTPTSLPAEGVKSTITFNVTANASWKITSDAEWISFFPVGAGGAVTDYSVNVIVDANDGDARTAVITVTCGDLATATVDLSQAATPAAYVTVDDDDFTMFAEGQSRGMKITSNFDWTAESDSEWLTISPSSGSAGETTIVSVTAAENLEQAGREGNITITAKSPLGDYEKVLDVKQVAADEPLIQFDVADTLDIPAEGIDESEIKVTGNFDWTASCDSGWISYYPEGGVAGDAVSGSQNSEKTTLLTVAANTGISPRTACIAYECNGATFYLTIIQESVPVELNVSDPSVILKSGGTSNFAVESNYPWTATTDADWITISPDNGAPGTFNQVVLTAEANAGIVRTAEITVTAGDQTKTVIVSQDGEEPYLTIDKENTTVVAAGGTVYVNVSSNLDITATASESWITVTNDGDSYILNVEANPYAAARTAQVVFSGEGADLTATISVTEKGSDDSIILSEDFSWLHYGSTVFYDVKGETRYDYWTDEERAHGWTSTVVEVTNSPCLYARDGFVKLGKTKYAGDLISPKLSAINGTEDVTVTFYAVAYATAAGTKDDSLLTVSVIGPGTVSQSAFLINNWPNVQNWYDDSYDPWGESVAKRSFTITGATAETQIKFLGGADYQLSGVGTTKNRIFIDNMEVRRSSSEEPMTGLDTPVQWSFNATDKDGYTSAYVDGNALPAKEGTGYISFNYLPENTAIDVNGKEARVIGATGEPYNTGVWPGDYWEFTVPVKNFKSGTKVEFYGNARASGYGNDILDNAVQRR
jgi:hypothetical protein